MEWKMLSNYAPEYHIFFFKMQSVEGFEKASCLLHQFCTLHLTSTPFDIQHHYSFQSLLSQFVNGDSAASFSKESPEAIEFIKQETFWSENLMELRRMVSWSSFQLVMVFVYQKAWKICILSGSIGLRYQLSFVRMSLGIQTIWALLDILRCCGWSCLRFERSAFRFWC